MRGVNYDNFLTEFLNYEDDDALTDEEREQLEKEKRDHFEESDLWELYDRLGRNL